LILACVALACGSGFSRPRGVTASASSEGIDVSWDPVPGADAYRVQLADLETRQAVGEAKLVRETRARLPGVFSRSAGVWVDAVRGSQTARAVGFVSGGALGGNGDAWQIFGPSDFRGGALRVSFPSLSPGDRLGILLVNWSGRDGASAAVDVTGVIQAQPTARPSTPISAPLLFHDIAGDRVAGAAARPERAPAGPHRSFCVVPGMDFSRHVRKPATLVQESTHAEFFVDDEDLSHYDSGYFVPIAAAFEERVWPADARAFGAPTDVDQNGKLLVLFTHELGEHLHGGWLIGYFGNGDLLRARDSSPDCSDSGSNHGEIIYLNDVRNGGLNGYSPAALAATSYPATLAHELQHLINLGHRCVERNCDGPEETWINEALSKVAEDLAGFGWNGAQGRAEGAQYLQRSSGEVRGYDGRSLTHWESDPIGNYQGAHSFLRFFTDRLGDAIPAAIANGPGGADGVEDAIGRPLPRAMAEWASALLLSNEPGAAYNFSGQSWSPLHERLRHLDYRTPGEQAAIRADGIAAFVSGGSPGGPAEVTVRSSEDVPPHVVVVRIAGGLSR
jgi:hypothetical protein